MSNLFTTWTKYSVGGAGQQRGYATSTDNGTTWTRIARSLSDVSTAPSLMEFSSINGNKIVTGGDANSSGSPLSISTNLGSTWTNIDSINGQKRVVALEILDDGTIMVGTNASGTGRLFYTTDNGATFTEVASQISGLVYCIRKSSATGRIYIKTNVGFYVLNSSFTRVVGPLPNTGNSISNSIAVVPGAGTNGADVVWNIAQYGLYKSVDSGVSFTWVKILPDYLGWDTFGGPVSNGHNYKSIAATNDGRIFAAASNSEFAYSTNGGDTWIRNSNLSTVSGNASGGFFDLWVSGDNVFGIMQSTYELYRSTNLGQNFSIIDGGGNNSDRYVMTFSGYVPSNTAPSDILLSASSIQEGNAVNAVIGTLSAIDPDTGDTSFTFSISGGADAAKFNISGNSLRASQAFDYEAPADANADNVYVVEITAQDAGGLTYAKSFNISVSNNAADDSVAAPAANAVGGKVRVTVAVDPRTIPVLMAGSALPTGSVVRNSTDNKKFIKKAGTNVDYAAIASTVPAAWKWPAEGETFWAMLQDM